MIACNLNEALYFCVRILMETQKERKNRRTGEETTTTCSNRNSVVAAIGTNFVIRMYRFLLSSMVCRERPVRAQTRQCAAKDPAYQRPIPEIPSLSRTHISFSQDILFVCRDSIVSISFSSTSANANVLHNYSNCCCCCQRALELFFLEDKHQQIWLSKIRSTESLYSKEKLIRACARSFNTMVDWAIACTLALSAIIPPLDSHRL